MLNFKNKTVMITGAAGNLGRAVAEAFGSHGANLVLLDLNGEALESAYPGDHAHSLKCAADLMKAVDIAEAVKAAKAKFGGLNGLAAIAGGFHMGEAVHELPKDKWDLMMDLNARTLLNSVEAVVPGMIEAGAGKIVTIGANAARQGMAAMSAYIVAKSAVIRLTESMSAELRGQGINVNCVMPSIIDTPENRAAMPDADPGDWVSPEKLANVILFLCSEEASAVHGAAVPVVGLS
ncbi:MAG: SDR family NAD(P)-dependent oxidoreductase [Pseudomonadota bacterium]|nr:SDR family NAD(P)-dependent oxidoreductase [Pseudomonadota bacterium]